jgi:hypothetical protein
MDSFLKNNHLIKIFEFLILYMRKLFMLELVPGSAFTFGASFIRLSQGINKVINLDLAMLRYRHIKVLANVNGENNTL